MISAKEAAKIASEVKTRTELQKISEHLKFISSEISAAAQQGKTEIRCLIHVKNDSITNACLQELRRPGFSVQATKLQRGPITNTQLDISW